MRTVLAALALCTLGASAHAALVGGSATGSFGSFDPGPTTATATITDGPVATFAFGGTPASDLSFQAYAAPLGFSGDLDTPFAIGDVTALKNPTTTYPSVGTSVVLTTTLSFTTPVVTTQTLTFTFEIGLFAGLLEGTTDADLFGIPDVHPALVVIGGQRYDLALVGFDLDGETDDISLQEGIPYASQLFAQLTLDPTPVPEPATMALLLPLLAFSRLGRRAAGSPVPSPPAGEGMTPRYCGWDPLKKLTA